MLMWQWVQLQYLRWKDGKKYGNAKKWTNGERRRGRRGGLGEETEGESQERKLGWKGENLITFMSSLRAVWYIV